MNAFSPRELDLLIAGIYALSHSRIYGGVGRDFMFESTFDSVEEKLKDMGANLPPEMIPDAKPEPVKAGGVKTLF